MALQTIAGKFYNVKFSKISQSSTIEGETFFDVRKHTSQIPHRFLRGKSSVEKGGFFDAKLITTNMEFIASASLVDMLANPALKKDLWAQIKPLTQN